MIDKKNTGSYYTPKILSDFLVQHISSKYLKEVNLKILEPSCGDGQFIESIVNSQLIDENYKLEIDLLDINSDELDKASKLIPKNRGINSRKINEDYLKFFLENKNTYSLIIGNPPYIKRENLQLKQIKRCEQINLEIKKYSNEIKSNWNIKNIWPAFVEAAILSLEDNGILCFVIPAEILQVKYTSELRNLIRSEFDRVEVFAFNELIFEGIQQDVVALIGIKDDNNLFKHGVSFYQVDSLEDLKEPKFTEKHSNIHRTNLDKWTNYILTDEELNLISELKSYYSPIKEYCLKAEVGIVSAANNYFLLNKDELKENKLDKIKNGIEPILPKGYVVPSSLTFTNEDFESLKESNKKVNFVKFPNIPKDKLNRSLFNYAEKGELLKLHERYKMTKRENWYCVPSIWKSEGLFIKRSHLYPKFFVNDANAYATDSFYRVLIKEPFSIRNLVFSFYNSLTFILAELEGRFYGGGVLELIPNEFKNLSIPYFDNVTDEQFHELDFLLRNETDIDTVLLFTNPILLPNIDHVELELIRKKLADRRLKKKVLTPNLSIEKIEKQFVESNKSVAFG